MPEQTLLEKLKNIESELKHLAYGNKTDNAYFKANEIASQLRHLIGGNDIRLDAKILDKYPLKGSDKSKNSLIEEFKEETLFDLRRIIDREESSILPLVNKKINCSLLSQIYLFATTCLLCLSL